MDHCTCAGNDCQLFTKNGAADPFSVAEFRRAGQQWLECNVNCDAELRGDIVLAMNEALSNCVDHAYQHSDGAGQVMALRISYDLTAATLTVYVTDHGCWTEPVATPANRLRGRGIPLMRALADELSVHGTEHGTTVRMCFDLHTATPG